MQETEVGLTVAEVGELYPHLSARLERVVRAGVRASDAVVEDACQFAWSRLLHRCNDVRRESVHAWLVKVAVHEAFKVLRREARKVPLDVLDGPDLMSAAPGPDELFEHRERLAALRDLPDRQQRLMWLKGLGLSYVEMARQVDATPRTVERQLLRARSTMRATNARAAA